MENLQCTGDENHIYDCSGNKFGDNTCTHDQDAGIICPSKYNEISIFLCTCCTNWLHVYDSFADFVQCVCMVQCVCVCVCVCVSVSVCECVCV